MAPAPPTSGASNACTQGRPTTFQIRVSYSCVEETGATLAQCLATLHSYETNGAPVSFSSYLYLQGLNRILADFWYMEESMNGGPPIGHTNLQSWNNDINKNTYFLNKRSTNLYKGIGMKVPVSISIRSISNSGGYISNSTLTLTKNYYFPWIGDAVQIAQNLSEHHFQPYYPNTSSSTTPQYPKLAPGEYYINNPSEHPDPLLLYLICTNALSPSDPIVRNALGTYNVSKFFSSGNCANNSSYSGTGSGSTSTSSGTSSTGSFSSFSVSACNSVLNATPPSSPNLSLSTLINNAQKFIGDNYSFNRPNCHVNVPNETDIEGGPNGIPGIDCSSLVSVLYDAMGIPIPKSSVTETQYSSSMSNLLNFMYTPASLGSVSAGDIVYFFVPGDSQGTPQHEALITSYSNDQNFSTIQATDFGQGVQQVNYTNFPLCLTPPGDTTVSYSNMCIVGFASPAVGSFK
jgi:cell wall-associated NlpC family hydrolase